LTTMQEIRERVDRIRRGIFIHSLFPKYTTELSSLYQQALDLRDSFFDSSFLDAESVEELEDLRFGIVESELNLRVLVSEATYLDTQEHMRALHDLYQTSTM